MFTLRSSSVMWSGPLATAAANASVSNIVHLSIYWRWALAIRSAVHTLHLQEPSTDFSIHRIEPTHDVPQLSAAHTHRGWPHPGEVRTVKLHRQHELQSVIA